MLMKKQEGFTLIEVLLSLTIISIVSFVVYSSYFSAVGVSDYNQDKIDFQQLHRIINLRISPYVRMADKIEILDAGQRMQLSIPLQTDGSTNYNKIEFGINSSNNLYYRKHGSMGWFPNKNTFIYEKITDFSIKLDNDIIIMTVTIENDNGDSYTFTNNFYPRVSISP